MKNRIINYIKELFGFSVDNKKLFEARKKSFLLPLVLIVLSVCMMTIPGYIRAKNVPKEEIIKQFPQIYEPMRELFTSSLECKIENSTLSCDENAKKINMLVGNTVKYTVIANESNISAIDVVYNNPKDTDNLIILLKKQIKIRYSEHDYINQKVNVYEISGTYSELEGFDFVEISNAITENPELADHTINSFVYNIYLSNISNDIFMRSLGNAIASLLIFIFISSVIMKLPTLFKRQKGFNLGECIKISTVACMPALIVATLGYFIAKINFFFVFSIIYLIRILYIYFRYVGSKNNNIYNELYASTKEERFKI